MVKGGHTRRRLFQLIAGGGLTLAFGKFLSGAGNQAWAVTQRVQRSWARLPKRIRLSAEALRTPLESKSLSDVRDLISRSGPWADLTKDLEQWGRIGEEMRLIGPQDVGRVDQLFGFGNFDFRNEMCQVHNCGTNEAGTNGGTGNCRTQKCNDQICTPQSCGTHGCNEHDCGPFDCNTNTYVPPSVRALEIEQNLEHPFIQELMEQFRVRDIDALLGAVDAFVGQNGYAIPGR